MSEGFLFACIVVAIVILYAGLVVQVVGEGPDDEGDHNEWGV